jgi:hypothetical protein
LPRLASRAVRPQGLPCLEHFDKESSMPVILWLLGVPLVVILLFMLIF